MPSRQLYLAPYPCRIPARDDVVCEMEIPKTGALVLDDLAARQYEARVEIGPGPGWEVSLLASSEVAVPAGARATLLLTLADPPDAVRFAGSLRIHEGWGKLRPQLHAQRVGAEWVEVRLDADGTWDAGLVRPGPYVVTVGETGVEHGFEVGRAGLTDAVIELAAPADVEVRVIDDTGAVADVKSVTYVMLRLDGTWGAAIGMAVKRDGRFRFRVPAGEVALDLDSDHHMVARDGEFHVQAGRNEITLRTERLCTVVVTFTFNGAPVSVFDDVEVEVVAVGHDGSEEQWSASDLEMAVAVSGPGRYVLRVPQAPKGFLKPKDRTIDLAKGQVLRRPIALERDE